MQFLINSTLFILFLHYLINLCTDLCMHIIHWFIKSNRFFNQGFRSDPSDRNYRQKLHPSAWNRRTSDGLPLRRGHPMINAADQYPPPSMMIIQNQKLVASWFYGKRPSDIRILISNSGFTFNQIGIEFLKHYIENSNADFHTNWILMFMNNHENHCIHEFIIFANDNHICFYFLTSHLIHCIQFLNVGVFQIYKHWHDVVIQKKITTLFVEYSIFQFLKNFNKMWINIFKSVTIQHVFQKTNMWSVNTDLCIEQFKIYNSKFCKKVKKSVKNKLNHFSLL